MTSQSNKITDPRYDWNLRPKISLLLRDEDKDLSGKKDIADWFFVKLDEIEIAGSKCRNGTFSESKDKNFDFEFRADFDNGCSTQSAENGKLIQSYHFAGDNSIPGLPIITSRRLAFVFRWAMGQMV